MKKCIVTGAAGFIGSTLCEELIRRGHSVVGIDCFTDYYPRSYKQRNIEALRGEVRFSLIEEDLLVVDLEKVLEGVDVVFHEAAQAGVRASWGSEFTHYTNNNILATQRLLEACKEKKNLRLVYASSSSVYGDSRKLPMTEDDPVSPVSPYGVTKLAGENLCRLYWKNFGLETVSLRYFTVYGPRQRPDMGFHKFIRAGLAGKPIRVYGDGEQTRDFTFVSDIVEANILAAEKGTPGAVYNIGGGGRVTLKEALGILSEQMDTSLNLEFVPAAKGDVRHTWSNTDLARSELGFEPTVSLEKGLRREVEWFRKYRLVEVP